MNQLILIENDLYDIAARLKSIDENYRVYYNANKMRYEVHNVAQHGGTLAFVVPYDELDCRTVTYALYSRVENAERIFADAEKHNELLEKQAVAGAAEFLGEVL